MTDKKGLVILFPGIGYTNDRPLLYYTGKMAVNEFGYDLKKVEYQEIPDHVKGNSERMRKAFRNALEAARKELKDVKFAAYPDVVLVSKSIGTVVAGAFSENLSCRHIYFTPLAETFEHIRPESGIAFHGTADPWARDEEIARGCREKNIPLSIIPDANHSLETGDVRRDIRTLGEIMEQVYRFLLTAPGADQALA